MGAPCLSEEGRQEVAVFLLERSSKGKLLRGVMKEATAKWHVSCRSVSDVWKLANKSRVVGDKLNVRSKRIGNNNKKKVLPNVEFIQSLDVELRDTMDRLAKQCKVGVGTVHSWVNNGLLKAHSSSLHPYLSDANKISRLKHALKALVIEQVQPQSLDLNAIPTIDIKFGEMSHTIHMDEKWFNMFDDNHKVYLTEGEEPPYRSCQSKRYITKVTMDFVFSFS